MIEIGKESVFFLAIFIPNVVFELFTTFSFRDKWVEIDYVIKLCAIITII